MSRNIKTVTADPQLAKSDMGQTFQKSRTPLRSKFDVPMFSKAKEFTLKTPIHPTTSNNFFSIGPDIKSDLKKAEATTRNKLHIMK